MLDILSLFLIWLPYNILACIGITVLYMYCLSFEVYLFKGFYFHELGLDLIYNQQLFGFINQNVINAVIRAHKDSTRAETGGAVTPGV